MNAPLTLVSTAQVAGVARGAFCKTVGPLFGTYQGRDRLGGLRALRRRGCMAADGPGRTQRRDAVNTLGFFQRRATFWSISDF